MSDSGLGGIKIGEEKEENKSLHCYNNKELKLTSFLQKLGGFWTLQVCLLWYIQSGRPWCEIIRMAGSIMVFQ